MAVTLPYTETFTGANGAAWASGAWTPTVPSGASANIQSNSGQITTPSASYVAGARQFLSGMPVTTNTDIVFDVMFPSLVECYVDVVLRTDGTMSGATGDINAGYSLGIFPGSGANSMSLQQLGGGYRVKLTADLPAGAFVAGTYKRIRLQMIDSWFRVRVWTPGDTEPSTWLAEVSDIGYYGSGKVLLAIASGTTSTSQAVRFDNVTVTSPASPTPGPTTSAPVGDLTGWHQVFVQDFNTTAALGSVGTVYGEDIRGYSGVADTSGMGDYDPDNVLSVPASSSYLDIAVHAASGRGKVAAPLPRGYTNQTYGRYSVRFRSDYLPGYKIAFLLWPLSEVWNEGEIDFPEGNLNGPMAGGSAVAGSFDGTNMTFDPTTRIPTPTDTQDWHVATIEWTPGSVKWYWDDVLLDQTTNPAGVPTTPMRWVLQTETNTDGDAIDTTVSGHVQIDWVVVYEVATTPEYDPTQFFAFFI